MFQVQYIDPLKKRRYADLAMNFPDAEGAYRIGVSTIGFFIYSRARCNARMSNSSIRRLLSTGSVPMAVFSSEVSSTELDLRATVFLPEHCSVFCFLVQKIYPKMIN
jgi:hypothetical protein